MDNINPNSDFASNNLGCGNSGVRPEHTCNLLVSAVAHVSRYVPDMEDETDPMQDVLDEAFCDFAHCDVINSFKENGVRFTAANEWKPEQSNTFNVQAEIWARLQITLPFEPSRKPSLAQQRCIHRNVAEVLLKSIGSEYEPQVSDAGVWLTDDTGTPTHFLTGLFDVMEGRLSERRLKRVTANAWRSIPGDLWDR